ncbi:MAG: hypothetical protein K6B75_08415 [Lachnospiraceae bacterium]|nr:hypothetical protein [Lachnospiraceae bacterium]
MKTLEEIFQIHFGCKKPFDKDGDLTVSGLKAYSKLLVLLDDLNSVGIVENNNYHDVIDEILKDNY